MALSPVDSFVAHSKERSTRVSDAPMLDLKINRTSLKRLRSAVDEFQDAAREASKRKRRRTYYEYGANMTIARVGEIDHDQGVGPFDPSFKDWRKVIKDHAYRRMQVFYYQLLFYFKENCQVSQGRTVSQHGKASCACCSAAHSAILPNLVDENGLMHDKLYLYHNMNATIEMPDLVNNFDCVIERQMRSVALEYINQVSLENLHPYDALQGFASQMQKFFDFGRNETLYRFRLLDQIQELEQEISELESCEILEPVSWIRKYAKAVFQLKECRKEFQANKSYSLPIPLEKYESPRRELFINLWNSCPNENNYLDQITNHKQLNRYLSKRPHLPHPENRTLFHKKKEIREHINQFHPVDLWLMDEKKAIQLYERVKPYLSLSNPIPKHLIEAPRERLKEAHIILELQAKGSVCPPYKYLSGKKVGDTRVAYNIEQLIKQKKILQSSLVTDQD